MELRGKGVYVVEWATAPWRVSRRHVSGTLVQGRDLPAVESRTLGAEELAGHRVEGECYLRAWVAVTVRVEVAR